MPLILSVRSVERTGTAAPPPLRLDRRGAVIGRAPGTDWTLPDERSTVSSRHCEIAFRSGAYLIADTSTNGTWVNGKRLAAPQQLNDGDVIGIGPYQVAVAVSADEAVMPAPSPAKQAPAAGARPAGDEGAVAVEHLLRSAGLRRADVAAGDGEILAAAGTLLRELTAGTAMLLERRARARKELGAAADGAGDNPLKQPGPALARLLGPPGTLPPERAVGDAFADIEAHQLASLKAMQGAMKATLDRFSPAAIRARGGGKGDAVLWQDYERAFTAGDSAFIEVFAREFRQAYEGLAKRTGRS